MIRLLLAPAEIIGVLMHPTISALATAAILHLSGLLRVRSVVVWIAAAPAIYFLWLVILVVLYAADSQIVGRLAPKPRRLSISDGGRAALKLIGLARLYRRASMLSSLPFARSLVRLPVLRSLALLTYAPSVHLGRRVVIYGDLLDPDLTFVGDHALIGFNASVVAHTMTTDHEGNFIYATAPVRIGRGAVIGGESFVGMGSVIGEDAVVELCSHVAPFTIIPPGEVWGGNPAVFRRRRDGTGATGTAEAAPAPATPVTGAAIRDLVARTLELPPEDVGPDFGREVCARWDSLAQLAIAAAVYDRFGIRLSSEEVFSLSTVADLERAVGRDGRTEGASESLPHDPELLPLLDRGAATRALAARVPAGPTSRSMRIVIAASFTAEPLTSSLRTWSRAFDVDANVRFCDFGQVAQALLDPDGPFAENRDGLNVVLLRPEDLAGSNGAERAGSAEQLLEAVARFAGRPDGGATLVVGTLPPPVSGHFEARRDETDRLRAEWSRRLAGIERVETLDFAAIIERLGTAEAVSVGLDVRARAPYSPRAYQELGIELARIVRRRSGLHPSAKVAALDCDGTLWGGVLGEDGLGGIELGPEGRGRGFQLFQGQLRRLKERGVLLVLVTRNEEADVWEVFDKHPGMVLGREDIAAWRIGWSDKSASLIELADELNLGLDSFVLFDDDPAVHLEVAARAPRVKVVPLPAEPERYSDTVSRLWLFDRGPATVEDRDRTQMIRQESERRRAKEIAAGLDDYLRQLELRVDFRRAGEKDLPRVAQLTRKTNQFNLSLRRRDLDEVRAFGPEVGTYVVSASDRFGDYGTIGVAILSPSEADAETVELDTLLMSCRALGRGIEQAFLGRLCEVARARGARRLRAPFVEGPRNQPMLKFLEQSFGKRDVGLFEISLDEEVAIPGHITWESEPAATTDV